MENLKHVFEKTHHDENTFRDIYEHTIDRVFNYVLIRVRERDIAKEIVQEIYLSLWKSFPNFHYQSDEEFYGFLWKIVRREIIRSRRKKRFSTVQLLPEHDTWDGEENPEDYRYLKKVLDSLKEKYRIVVELRYFEQYSFQEIGEALGVSEGNAKVIHGRAMKKLRQTLETYGYT